MLPYDVLIFSSHSFLASLAFLFLFWQNPFAFFVGIYQEHPRPTLNICCCFNGAATAVAALNNIRRRRTCFIQRLSGQRGAHRQIDSQSERERKKGTHILHLAIWSPFHHCARLTFSSHFLSLPKQTHTLSFFPSLLFLSFFAHTLISVFPLFLHCSVSSTATSAVTSSSSANSLLCKLLPSSLRYVSNGNGGFTHAADDKSVQVVFSAQSRDAIIYVTVSTKILMWKTEEKNSVESPFLESQWAETQCKWGMQLPAAKMCVAAIRRISAHSLTLWTVQKCTNCALTLLRSWRRQMKGKRGVGNQQGTN